MKKATKNNNSMFVTRVFVIINILCNPINSQGCQMDY